MDELDHPDKRLWDEIYRLREALIEAQHDRVRYRRQAEHYLSELKRIDRYFGGVIRKERKRLNAAQVTRRKRRCRQQAKPSNGSSQCASTESRPTRLAHQE